MSLRYAAPASLPEALAFLAERGPDQALDARIQSMETAFRMQFAATDAFDLGREPQRVRDEYGKGHFADACLLARRLSERSRPSRLFWQVLES